MFNVLFIGPVKVVLYVEVYSGGVSVSFKQPFASVCLHTNLRSLIMVKQNLSVFE